MNKDSNDKSTQPTKDPDWFERHVSLIIGALVVACIGLLAAELALRPWFNEHHPAHFELENIFGYQAAIGFVAFVCVVFLGKFLRIFVRRDEDYYDQ